MHRDRYYYRFPLGTVVIISVLVSVSVSVLGTVVIVSVLVSVSVSVLGGVNTPLIYIQDVDDRTIVTVDDHYKQM